MVKVQTHNLADSKPLPLDHGIPPFRGSELYFYQPTQQVLYLGNPVQIFEIKVKWIKLTTIPFSISFQGKMYFIFPKVLNIE